VAIAEIYESELADMEKAISSYQQAADYYKGEESNRFGGSSSLAADFYNYTLILVLFYDVCISETSGAIKFLSALLPNAPKYVSQILQMFILQNFRTSRD